MAKKKINGNNIKYYIHQRVPVRELFSEAIEVEPILSLEIQENILDELKKIVTLNPYYVKSFLKKYIEWIEDRKKDCIDELYEFLCTSDVMDAMELNATEPDILQYHINGFSSCNDRSFEDTTIGVKELPRLISGSNTTGLRTWEASLYLANYLNENIYDLESRTVLELGSGTGLVLLSLIKNYHFLVKNIRQVILTDGSSELIENLGTTFDLNNIDQNEKKFPLIRAQQLIWGPPEAAEMIPQADYVFGADITYDPESFHSLCITLDAFLCKGTKKVVIAATRRNDITLELWDKKLDQFFSQRWRIVDRCPIPHEIECSCWFQKDTPEIRVYEIYNLNSI